MKPKRKPGSALNRRALLIPLLMAGPGLMSLKAAVPDLPKQLSLKADTDKTKSMNNALFIEADSGTTHTDILWDYKSADWHEGIQRDSLNYVINGKKATKAEFSKLNANDIEALHLISPENAAVLSQKFGNKYNVLFVTTGTSAQGKALLPKLEKICDSGAVLIDKSKSITTEDSNDNMVTVSVDPKAHFQAIDLKPVANRVGVIYSGGQTKYTVYGGKNVHFINGKTTNAYAYSTGGGKIKNLSSSNFYVAGSGANNKIMAFSEKRSGGEALDNLNDKLIFIDDKEATESDLKKLPAFDIDKISAKDDYETRRKYGDKAKKGVVYIYTRNAKK